MGILEIAAIPQIGTFDSGLLEWLVGLQLPACHVGKASECNDARNHGFLRVGAKCKIKSWDSIP
ncbi:MAG: hypothetical protein BRC38_07175 [Cyanobacteria bacterium QH_6_48_35]|nr:MAG: hypothetical protein BRC38_07175 [Cyanobacteria bacterium QH_6_48_35]